MHARHARPFSSGFEPLSAYLSTSRRGPFGKQKMPCPGRFLRFVRGCEFGHAVIRLTPDFHERFRLGIARVDSIDHGTQVVWIHRVGTRGFDLDMSHESVASRTGTQLGLTCAQKHGRPNVEQLLGTALPEPRRSNVDDDPEEI